MMRMTLGRLRDVLREAGKFPGQPAGRNVLSPDINHREQVAALSAKAIDTADDPDGLPEHLRDPTVDPEDCYGPVPPDAEKPYLMQDPLASDYGPQPFSGAGRLRKG